MREEHTVKSVPGYIAVVFALAIALVLGAASPARAHCDTMNGPVVAAARQALETGDAKLVLKWVKKETEPEVVEAFRRTLAVRKQGGEVRDLADRYFFETVVRLHRAGEGEPYTGLKPAESVDPFIERADAALEKGEIAPLAAHTSDAVAAGLRSRYERVAAARKRANDSVEAGREFVEAYVDYVHYVEQLANIVGHGGPGKKVEHK